jgi:hypothetical protein
VTGRVLHIELRRSIASWLGAIFLVLTLGLCYGLTGPWGKGSGAWLAQWASLAQWQRYFLDFTWPAVFALGAWQGSRQRRSTMDELLSATPRPAWQRAAVLAGAAAITLTLASLVFFAIGAVQVARSTGYFTLGWLPTLLVGILAVAAGVVAGMGIGHLLPYLVTPPLVGVLGFGLMIAAQWTPSSPVPVRVQLFSPVLPGAATAFVTVAGSVHIGQALLFAGLAASGFLVSVVRGVRARIASVLPLALGVALALAVLPGRPATAYPADPGAVALVCDDHGPRVCVTRAHQNLLATLAGPGRQALARLAVLPGAPTTVIEIPDSGSQYVPLLPRPGDTVQVDLNDHETRYWGFSRLDPATLEWSMLLGAGTEPCATVLPPGAGPDADLLARVIAASWLFDGGARPVLADDPALASRGPGFAQEADAAEVALLSLPRPEQVRRVAAVRQAGLTCQGDPLALLTRGSAFR